MFRSEDERTVMAFGSEWEMVYKMLLKTFPIESCVEAAEILFLLKSTQRNKYSFQLKQFVSIKRINDIRDLT